MGLTWTRNWPRKPCGDQLPEFAKGNTNDGESHGMRKTFKSATAFAKFVDQIPIRQTRKLDSSSRRSS